MYAQAGISYRMKRLFERKGDGRTVILPVDHGISLGHLGGLERPLAVAVGALSLGADGILATVPLLGRHPEALGGDPTVSRIAALDFLHDGPDGPLEGVVTTAAQAAVVGCDATKVLMPWGGGSAERRDRLERLAQMVEASHLQGLPCIVEPLPTYSTGSDPASADQQLADAARVAVEMGADVLKVQYPAQPKRLSSWCEEFEVPLILLGGPKGGSVKEILGLVHDGISAGARGIAVGRKVWQRDDADPWRLLRALVGIVHEGWSVSEAEASVRAVEVDVLARLGERGDAT